MRAIRDYKNVETVEKKFSEDPIKERLLNVIVRGHFHYEDTRFLINYIQLDPKLFEKEDLYFSRKEVAWLNHNFRFWINLIENSNAKRILSKIHSRKFNTHTLAKELKINYNAVKWWIDKFKSFNIMMIDSTGSYGNENLYWLNTKDYPQVIRFFLDIIEEKTIKASIEKARKELK